MLIGYLDMMVNLGHGQDRSRSATPAELPPAQRLVWQCRSGAPFIVSDHVAQQALSQWRQRSTWQIGIGVVPANV